MRVASRMVELALRSACVKRIVVHDHVVGATLEPKTLLVLVRLGGLGRFPVVLLELLAPGPDLLIVSLGVNDYLMGVVPIVAAIEYLLLMLNLIVVWQLSRVVYTDLTATFT